MLYRYETHLHTSQASACASSSGDEYIEAYIKAGYSGIIVTDHFFQGNTCVPNHEQETWENRVNQYCSGYEKALEKAKEINIANKTGILVEHKYLNNKIEYKIKSTY